MIKVVIVFLFSSAAVAKTSMDLQSYLSAVKESNPSYKAAVQASQGTKLRQSEADLLVLPVLTLEAKKSVDEKDTFNPNFTGTQTDQSSYLIGIEQYTPIGLQLGIKYEQFFKDIVVPGGSSIAIPEPQYYGGSPSIQLTQSLWRNGFGREIRAKREMIDFGAQASFYAERFKVDSIQAEAQMAFVKYYFSKKILNSIQESLDVAQKLRDWTKRRWEQDLGDKADYLQAKAAFEFRQFEFIQAQQDEKSAARFFNSLRGIDSDIVEEQIVEPKISVPQSLSYTSQKVRDDVRAAKKQLEYAKAVSAEGAERGKPTLDLFATYGWSGLSTSESSMRSEAFKDDFPYYTVGIRFQSPLMFGILDDMKEGYQKEVQAAKLNLERKNQEQERDFKDLASKIESLSFKLKLAEQLESTQKEKVIAERLRQKKGRTTLFQVLQFEQDYVDSQLNKYKTEVELKTYLTQLELYKEDVK